MLSVIASRITKWAMAGNAHQCWVIPFLEERNGPAYERCRSICLECLLDLLPNWVFFVGVLISRDIRAGIFGVPVGFRTHEGLIGAPVVGTRIEGLCATFAYPRKLGAHASGQKRDLGDG